MSVLGRLELLLVAGALLLLFVARIGGVAFHPDESQWISSSEAWEVFARGDRRSPVWNVTLWTTTQPPGARYVIGLGRSLGGYGPDELPPGWAFALSREANIAAGAVPSSDLLWWSRLPMALLAAASCWLSFVLLRRVFGAPAAYIGLLLLAANLWFTTLTLRAMAEAPMLFVLLLVSAAAIACADRRSVAGRAAWLPALGLASGLATSIKPSGALAVVAAGAVWTLAVMLDSHGSGRLRRALWAVLGCVVLLVVAGAVVWALNPYLDPAPLARSVGLFTYRADEIDKQLAANPAWAVGGVADRLALWYRYLLVETAPLRVSVAGVAMALFVGTGLLYCCAATLGGLRRRRLVPAAVLLLTAAVMAGPMLLTPLNWDRYLFVPAWYSTLLAAGGVAVCAGALLRPMIQRWAIGITTKPPRTPRIG